MSTKTLAIVGGVAVLVLIIVLVLALGVFGGSEERDRKAVVNAANEVLDTMRTGDKYSDFTDLVCPEYRAEEDVVEEIDAILASKGITFGEVYDELDVLEGLVVTEREVEFPSVERREAIVYFDGYVYGSGWKFRRVGGDWLYCEGDYSDVPPEYLLGFLPSCRRCEMVHRRPQLSIDPPSG